MNTEIIDTYKSMLDMLEKLRIRVSLGADKNKMVVYDHEFFLIKELLYNMIIKEYENK